MPVFIDRKLFLLSILWFALTPRQSYAALLPNSSLRLSTGGGRPSGGGRPTGGNSGGKKPRPPIRPPPTASSGPSGDTPSGDTGGSSDECFPRTALVTLANKEKISISDVRTGDSLADAAGGQSPVFMFSHRARFVKANFVKLHTVRGNLTVTGGHLIYTSTGIREAGSIRQGDSLQDDKGFFQTVQKLETVRGEGLYNPHTLSGELLVDRFRVSCYTTSLNPTVAESLLVFARASYRTLGTDLLTDFLADGKAASFTRRILQSSRQFRVFGYSR